MFDVGFGELLALGVVALLVFGPERLPQAAAQAGRLVRELRTMASGARQELSEHIDPDLASMDLRSLDPRTHVRDVVNGSGPRTGRGAGSAPGRRRPPTAADGAATPRFDPDAT